MTGHPASSVYRDLRRRVALLTPGERLWWLTFFPIGVLAALLETLAGVVVFALITALVNPPAAGNVAARSVLAALSRAIGPAGPLTLTAMAAALYIAKNAMLLTAAYYRARIGGDIASRLSARVVRGYLSAPYPFHLARTAADASQNVLLGVPAVLRLLDAIVTFATELLVIAGFLILLLRLAFVETALAAIIIGGMVAVFVRTTRGRYHRLGARHYALSAAVLHALQQTLTGIKQIKSSGREQYFGDRIAQTDDERTRVFMSHAALEAVPRLLTETAFVLGLVGLVAMMLRHGPTAAVLPFIGLYAYAGLRLVPAGHRLAVQAGNVRYELAASEALCRDVEALSAAGPVADDAPEEAARAFGFRESLRLTGVGYGYAARTRPVLVDIDLQIAPGECVAIVGPTGSGKTTLVDLMLGLIEPTAGRITVDGIPVAGHIEAWRRLVGYVPQDPFLVDDTLRHNIAFGVPDAGVDDGAVLAAVQVAQLAEFVATLPEGLETRIGERGVRLSGGERQRVSIARALYRDPALLIFDEATSSLDPGTEQAITRAIERLKGQKTLLVIAHRLSTVERADRLVVLREGRVDAVGTYAELVRTSAAFRSLAALVDR